MTHAYLVPSLESLFTEFDRLAPKRSKASDGGVGDQAHRERVSDHNIDDGPNQGATPSEDADSTPEVHAADVTADLNHPTATMGLCCNIIVDRHRRGVDNRLQNVIYNGLIASDSWGWTWRDYTGTDRHIGHAHFSCKYTNAAERDTSAWGLLERFEDDMDQATFTNYLRKAVTDDAALRLQLAKAVWTTDNVLNIYDQAGKPEHGGQSLVRWGDVPAQEARDRAGELIASMEVLFSAVANIQKSLGDVLERLPAANQPEATTAATKSTSKAAKS